MKTNGGKLLPWEKKREDIEKVADIDLSSGNKLSDDTKSWPEEILDLITDKFPFLKNYPIMLKVDKRDEDKKSAFLYAVVTISDDKKIGIPVMVCNSVLMPVFPFSFNQKFYPLTESSVSKIIMEDFSLGTPKEAPRIDYESPWRFMQRFLQTTMFQKKASVAGILESMPEGAISALLKYEQVADIVRSVGDRPQVIHVKTAFIHRQRYCEIVDGRTVRVDSVYRKRSINSKIVKVASINEAIANEESTIHHEVSSEPSKSGVSIHGDNVVPIIGGKTYKIREKDRTLDAVAINSSFSRRMDKDDPQSDVRGALMWSQESGFVFLPRISALEISDKKVEMPAETTITANDIGKTFLSISNRDGRRIVNYVGVLRTYIEDGDEVTYVFNEDTTNSPGYKKTYVYSKFFKEKLEDRYEAVSCFGDNATYVGKPLSGYFLDIGSIRTITKEASWEKGMIVRVEPAENGSPEQFHLTIKDNSKSSPGYIFDYGKKSFASGDSDSDIDDTYDKDVYQGELEHELLRRGIAKSAVDDMVDEVNKSGGSTVLFPSEDISSPSDREVKVASAMARSIRKNLPIEKIADLVPADSAGDIFSLHLVSPENVSEFMRVIPYIDDIIDYLCRYYIYKNIGLTSAADKTKIHSLEGLIVGMENVVADLKKYKSAYESDSEIS